MQARVGMSYNALRALHNQQLVQNLKTVNFVVRTASALLLLTLELLVRGAQCIGWPVRFAM